MAEHRYLTLRSAFGTEREFRRFCEAALASFVQALPPQQRYAVLQDQVDANITDQYQYTISFRADQPGDVRQGMRSLASAVEATNPRGFGILPIPRDNARIATCAPRRVSMRLIRYFDIEIAAGRAIIDVLLIGRQGEHG